jgi:glycosyltransferase involved in cell wall biosynthesis
MISICIPVFNCNVTNLAETLHQQANENGIAFEIILIDDCSSDEFKLINKDLSRLESVIYLELEKNIGRSAIRNLFLKYAQFNYLLFLDCDSQITDNLFITNYITHCKNNAKVICGGTKYPLRPNFETTNFRWKYGVSRESASFITRSERPYLFFKTNNFVISKEILNKIRFDERLSQYGHEDSLFAYQLMKNKIQILHISNPVIHEVTESFPEYLSKTKLALKNLHFISSTMNLDDDFIEMNKLLKVYTLVRKNHLRMLFLIGFGIMFPFIKLAFYLGWYNLRLFDLYKIGYFVWLSYLNKVD